MAFDTVEAGFKAFEGKHGAFDAGGTEGFQTKQVQHVLFGHVFDLVHTFRSHVLQNGHR